MKSILFTLVSLCALFSQSYAQCGTTNIAQGKTVESSSQDAFHTAAQAVDGNNNSDWWPSGGNGGPANQYLTIDLGQNYLVCSVAIDFLDNAHHAASYTIQLSTDNSNWTTPVTITGNTTVNVSHSITATSARYVKLAMTEKPNTWSTYAIREFKIYNTTNQAPTVSITSPSNNASFTAGSNITINATAADADGTVSKVEFYQGSTKLGEDNLTPFTYTWNGVAAGSYSLTAVATDNGTATTTSAVVNITVTAGGGGGDWSLTGNAGTTPGTNFLGTTDNKDLVFKVNNVEQVRLLSSGNVGIGVTAPGARLSLPNVDAGNGPVGITWYSPTPLAYAIHKTEGSWGAPNYQQLKVSWLTGVIIDPGSSYSKSYVDVQGGGMRLTGASSILGIGTTAPLAQLHTTGTVRFAGLTANNALTRVIASDANGNLAWRDAATLGGSGTTGWTAGGNAVASAVTLGTTSNYALPFITNNVERMRIGANGNIGIGTVNIGDANFKLFVETGIRTRKVKVDIDNWSDYVFARDYVLMPLAEVERYIQQHRHLPGVPSATEVQKNGLDVGSSQATLLKKIEELTLYVIEQNKKLTAQEKELEDLRKVNERINLLEQAIRELKK